MDGSQDSRWSQPGTVAGFARAAPNAVLIRFASEQLARIGSGCVLDLGCGAGRNAVPLAQMGWEVVGIDDSAAMLAGAAQRALEGGVASRAHWSFAKLDQVPVRDRSCDLLVAHGIWNLARSSAEFRRGIREAARVAKPGGSLFVFTFSRNTLPADAQPVAGETFVFTQFSGQPQCFVTEQQLLCELGEAGFARHPGVPLTEYNRPQPGTLLAASGPVIYEAGFRYEG